MSAQHSDLARQPVPRRLMILVIGLCVLVFVAALSITLVLSPNGEPESSIGEPPKLPIKVEVLDQARPSEDCPSSGAPPAASAGQQLITVARIIGSCLVIETQAVNESELAATLELIRAEPDVAAADKAVSYQPGDNWAPQPGQPERQWGLDDLQAGEVSRLWPAKAPEVRVAVIDTGVDSAHVDLDGQIVSTRGTELIDEAGYPDRVLHGTHVAGIIAAKADGEGVAGLTPAAKLLDVQYYRGGGNVDQPGIADEIVWAVDHGAQVLNMSIQGSDGGATEEAALLYAERVGVVAVGIAGNCGGADDKFYYPPFVTKRDIGICPLRNMPKYPATYASVLSVGAYDEDGGRSAFSTRNWTVDLAAPGSGIVSTCLTRDAGSRTVCDQQGTSMAAPFVSATAALLKARHPAASPAAIRTALMQSARPGKDQQQGVRNDDYGMGKLDPVAAAKFLDDHPGDPAQPAVKPDTIVAGVITDAENADPDLKLVLADGSTQVVQGVTQDQPMRVGETVPRIAFSRDGAWFAAANPSSLTVVNAKTGKQQSIECRGCMGVAFNATNRLLSWPVERGGVLVYEPDTMELETTFELGYQPTLGDVGSGRVVGSVNDSVLVALSTERNGPRETLVELDASGFVRRLGDVSTGFGPVITSADGRWLAYAAKDGCQATSPLVLVDLDQSDPGGAISERPLPAPGTSSSDGVVTDGVVTSLAFAGEELRVGWVTKLQNGQSYCKRPALDPAPASVWSTPVERGQSTEPVWQESAPGHAIDEHLQVGEVMYAESVPGRVDAFTVYRGVPQAGGPIKLAEDAVEVAIRPR